MARRTVGVEEEFLLFAEGAPELLDDGPAVVQAAERSAGPDDATFEKELMKAQTEHASPVASTLDELGSALASQRARLATEAQRRGGRLVASGTCPVDGRTETTDDPRYHEMADRFAAIARGELSCAMHVHVAIDSEDEGVAVLDRIAPWLPVLLALSANSPFHGGRDTGYASYRRLLWGQWPTSGPTAAFGDAATYHRTVDELIATGAARDPAMIYFDARLSRDHPTVEIRVCDVVRDVEDAVAIAGLARALVATAAADAAAGGPAPLLRPELLQAASWRAARYGVGERLGDVAGAPGGPRLVPAWELVDALVEHVRDGLDEHADTERVRSALAATRGRGTGERRQRDAAGGGLGAVIDSMTVSRDAPA